MKPKVGDYAKYNTENGAFGKVIDIYETGRGMCCVIKGINTEVPTTYYLSLEGVVKITKDEVIMELL